MSRLRTTSRWAASAVAVAIGSGGCAANPAPSGWLPRAPETTADPYGAWIEVSLSGGTPVVAGELLAVERDSVFVLSTAGTVHGIAISAGRRARIALYDSEWGQLGLWSGLGGLSTISHGWFLILTSPVWLIGGSIATGVHSHAPIVKLDSVEAWSSAYLYARFPAGLPADLPRSLPIKLRR